ncbi:DUF262 domain-containing protein [Sodalis ligni]|uniref:Uncharacterized protein DUF262 n=1 Tax=Sodalis ligni TaxID=2697027 RepID=A0A4V2Q2P3_9GAMM|nr:DUF262 domain-containing protein [Sodalis ligni]TCL03688.1 uncharacterized protein DUF262 [Sodalis ligni]
MVESAKTLADKLFPKEKDNDDLAIIDIPPEQRRLHTETYDFSIATIINYLKDGSIYIPKFQRNYVWTRSQASRLIESLIIQCPIPVIYLHQEKDEKLSVIDGNQRLTSIKLYAEDGFELQGLTAYPELEGNKFSDLDPRFRRHILNRTLRCITIMKETHPQIKIDVFERINTGAVQLNPQEVRHGVYHGPLFKMIDDLGEENIWKDLAGLKKDNRMKGNELILRCLSLCHSRNSYRKPLKKFLNDFSSDFQYISEEEELGWKSEFLTALRNINNIFGNKAFRILNDKLEPLVKNFNAALFDAVMVGFIKSGINQRDIIELDKATFLKRYQKVISEEKFNESITSGTSATALVNYRINTFIAFLREYFA